jgi:hypothetical protein
MVSTVAILAQVPQGLRFIMASLCPFEEVQELIKQFNERVIDAIASNVRVDASGPWRILLPSSAEVDNLERAIVCIIEMGEQAFDAPNTEQIDPLYVAENEKWKIWAMQEVERWNYDLESGWYRRLCDAYGELPLGWEIIRTRVGIPERSAQASDTDKALSKAQASDTDTDNDEEHGWVLVGK